MNPSVKEVESVSGLIERVTYHNAETGFAVLRVKVKGRREEVTVLGSVASVNAGEWLTAEGRWVRDREHGLQFKAERLECTEPESLEGIEKYLGSGLIKGIGPVYAKKLVAKFGTGVFDIIDKQSAKLEEVEGIGPRRRRCIKEAWAEQKVVRGIMVFLHSHGVGTSRAVRIYKTYGEEAIEKVRTDPYILARDIAGIGFKTADQIAARIGIPEDSVMRAQAGVQHILQTAASEGHCGLPQEQVLERAVALLGSGEERIQQAVDRMLSSAELIREVIAGEPLLFHPALQLAEAGIAEMLRERGRHSAAYPAIQIDKAIRWYEQKTSRTLAPHQVEAVKQVVQSRILVITGGPGVGKTTLIHAVLSILRAKGVRCVLAAPTGRAARRMAEATGMEARTIHRLLEFRPGGGAARNEGNPIDADLLVLDEVSMVDVPLMYKLLRALRPECHLILVGDVDQLPSVGPGMVLRDVIESGVVPVVRLAHVFRQSSESRIITAAHEINQGHPPENESAESDFHLLPRENAEDIENTVLKLVTERIPQKLRCDPVRDIQVLCPMNRGRLGARVLNQALQAALNPERHGESVVERFGWMFRVRDKVMQTRNNYDKEVFNGDIGFVTKISEEDRSIMVKFEEREVVYEFGELDELAPAYAITVHKSQGSEFPAVIIPVAMQHFLLLQRNLLYTAVTRGRRFVVVVGEKKAFALGVRRQELRHRYSGLLARLKGMT
jgi:exodeoxyribonuclease V alpha subunit